MSQVGNTPAWKRSIYKEVLPGRYNLPNLCKETGMCDTNSEARRLIDSGGGIWIDRWSDSEIDKDLCESYIWQRLEKVNPYLDKYDIELKEGWSLCFGKRIDDAICHRIKAVSINNEFSILKWIRSHFIVHG